MRRLSLAWALLACAAPALAAPAAAPRSARMLDGAALEYKTPDNWTIRGVYLEAKGTGKTFLLLHGRTRTKEEWLRLAKSLERAGYGYIAIDLRGHGDSATGPDGQPAPWQKFRATRQENPWADMGLDAQGAISWAVSQGVPEESIGIIGDDIGGLIGLRYAAVHPKVPDVVMLSPAMQYLDVTSVNAMRAYTSRPVLMIYSELDRTAARDTPVLYEFAKRSAGPDKAYMIAVPKVHGYWLSANGPIIRDVMDWLANPVTPPPPAVSTDTVTGSTQAAPAPAVPSGLPEQQAPQEGGQPQ